MKKILVLMVVALSLAFVSYGKGDNGPVTPDTHEWVDLGLPSGTLWATCNVGADTPEGYGDYFAWGETVPKDDYSWETYRWCNGYFNMMTKYCTSSSYGTVDNKTELDPEDEAAYVNWGSSWCMPTTEQQLELRNECTWTWTERNGVSGKLVTGPNGNSIFLPVAGSRYFNSFNKVGLHGWYWSRTLGSDDDPDGSDIDYSDCAYFLGFDLETLGCSSYYRYSGFNVRAVRVSRN